MRPRTKPRKCKQCGRMMRARSYVAAYEWPDLPRYGAHGMCETCYWFSIKREKQAEKAYRRALWAKERRSHGQE